MTPNKLDQLTTLTENKAASFDAYIISRIVRRILAFLEANPAEPLAFVPSSVNDIHRLIQRGMIAEEVQKAIVERLPDLQEEIADAFFNAADEISKDYIADSLMNTSDILAEGVKEATGLSLEDIAKQVHKERVAEGEEEPDIVRVVREINERMEQEKQKRSERSAAQAATPPQQGAINQESGQTVERPVNEPEKPAEKLPDYPDFVATCGYGNMLGICGINCRHTFSAFQPGVNKDRGQTIDYAENEKRYKLTQKQRAMERKIREIDRTIAALKAMGDSADKDKLDELIKKRKELGKEYADFTRENKLPSENWRFAIATETGTPQIGPGVLSRAALNPTELEKLDEMYRRTNADVRNLCRSTAPATEQAFLDACDNAYIKARGGISMGTVISEAIQEVARQGVTSVNYNSGRNDRIEVAIARAVRTGINQANADIVLGKCAERGINYVKVSEHMGARVTKNNDYTNHAWWQGKVYRLNWDNPALKKYSPAPAAEAAEPTAPESAKGDGVVYLDGELDVSKYTDISPDIRSTKVIATEKQLTHAMERHPEIGQQPERFFMSVLNDPDYIVRDDSHKNTALVIKKISDGNISHLVVLRLATNADNPDYVNSIITSWNISEKRLNSYLKNKDVVYKR